MLGNKCICLIIAIILVVAIFGSLVLLIKGINYIDLYSKLPGL
jgi:hypothetical protein